MGTAAARAAGHNSGVRPRGVSVPAERSLPVLNIPKQQFGTRDLPLDGWGVARAASNCTGPWGTHVRPGWLKCAARQSLQSTAYYQLAALQGQNSQPVLPAEPCSFAKPLEVAAGAGAAAAHPPAGTG